MAIPAHIKAQFDACILARPHESWQLSGSGKYIREGRELPDRNGAVAGQYSSTPSSKKILGPNYWIRSVNARKGILKGISYNPSTPTIPYKVAVSQYTNGPAGPRARRITAVPAWFTNFDDAVLFFDQK